MKCKLTMALLFTGAALFAQPVLEHTFSESATITSIEGLGDFYYSMDVINKECLIYDMDHQLMKSIPLPTLEGYYLADIQYVSRHLFNTDDLLELVYIYSKYVPTDLSYYYTFETKVINENGNVLLTVPGGGFSDVIHTETHGSKFLVYVYNYAVIPYLTETKVYSLPEQPSQAISPSVSGMAMSNAFPNPADDLVNIPVSLPEGIQSGSLEVLDIQGREILNYPINQTLENVVLPASHLSPGTYLYRVNAGNRITEARKLVVR